MVTPAAAGGPRCVNGAVSRNLSVFPCIGGAAAANPLQRTFTAAQKLSTDELTQLTAILEGRMKKRLWLRYG
jgi:hypothetical protein